jgi:two-component system, cell cycle sensor histidine kinase and response regulator CckA
MSLNKQSSPSAETKSLLRSSLSTMNKKHAEQHYLSLFNDYVKGPSENILLLFNELGRMMSASEIAPEIATEIHANALTNINAKQIIDLSEQEKIMPLMEVNMAYSSRFRQLLETQKRVSEEKYVQTMEQSQDLIFHLNKQHEITYCNSAYTQLVEESKLSLFDQAKPITTKDKNRLADMWLAIEHGNPWRGNIGFKLTNGAEIQVFMRAFAVFNVSGDISSYSFMADDITEQLLIKNRMEQSQRLSTLGEFASGIAHEFNNIMLIINGFAELIESSELKDSESNDFAQEIMHAVEKAKTLNNQILSFARKPEVTLKAESLPIMLDNIMALLHTAVGRTTSLTINNNALVDVYLSEGHLCQILTNLCINAKHANEFMDHKSEINIAFSIENEELIIKVKDNGCGISQKVQEKLFEPFFTTKDVGKGSGLGLSIVMGLVVHYKGEISVESMMGMGTQFTIQLPVINEPAVYQLNERQLT